MIQKNFLKRQLIGSGMQGILFIACLFLSLISLVALGGFQESVNEVLEKNAKSIHGGDIIIHSHTFFASELNSTLQLLNSREGIEKTSFYELYSVVRAPINNETLLSQIKIVEDGYPFYGDIILGSGRGFHKILKQGTIIVEQGLLERLNVQIGDFIAVGEQSLQIVDTIIHEPDRPLDFFSLGPRVFIHDDDRESVNLIMKGSRVQHTTLLKVDNQPLEPIVKLLEDSASLNGENIDTYLTARSGLQRFFNNLFFFLNIVSIFILLIAGLGLQSTLAAYFKERQETIAIIKTIGATNSFVLKHYLGVIFILGSVGTILGIFGGYVLQALLMNSLQDFLPEGLVFKISAAATLQGLLLGLGIVIVFSLFPLYRLKNIRPSFILRKDTNQKISKLPSLLMAIIIALFFLGIMFWKLYSSRFRWSFLLGVMGFLVLVVFLTIVILYVLKKLRPKNLGLRQALRGLFRPGNATTLIVVTLAASLAILFTLTFLEKNLDENLVQSFPKDAPNVFFLDIQPHQVDNFSIALGQEPIFFPIVRGRINTINDVQINREIERGRQGDNLGREFSLTYRNELLDTESLVKGDSLFTGSQEIEVSVLDEVLELGEMKLGDKIEFQIQGVPLTATISSIRTRTARSFQPYFYFVFPKEVLQEAPQTIFTGIRVNKEEIPALQNKIVAEFPNISVIDLTQVLGTIAGVLGQMTLIIRFFTMITLIAGTLIIISSIFATRLARTQEAVYFKVLGAKSRFVLQVFALESMIIGTLSALIALVIAHSASFLITQNIFDFTYHFYPLLTLVVFLITVGCIVFIGLVTSRPILKKKPIIFLKEQSEE